MIFLYFIWAIPMVVAINYNHEIVFYIRSHGVDIPEIMVVLLMGFAWAFMVCASAFFLASWKA